MMDIINAGGRSAKHHQIAMVLLLNVVMIQGVAKEILRL